MLKWPIYISIHRRVALGMDKCVNDITNEKNCITIKRINAANFAHKSLFYFDHIKSYK